MKLELNVSDDDWAFLELQAEESALEPAQVVAMLIRKARKAYEKPAPESIFRSPDEMARIQAAADRGRIEEETRRANEEFERARAEKRAKLQRELAELEDATQYAPPARDLPEGMTQGVVATTVYDNKGDMFSLPEFDESLLRQPEPDPIRSAIIPSSAAPGTLTGPVGVRRDLRGGDVMGDHRGNVLRRNFKHLGSG